MAVAVHHPRRRRRRPSFVVIFTAAVLCFLFLPIVVVVLFSFNASSGLSFPIEGLSTRWYEEVFTNPTYTSALRNSVVVALATAVLTTIIGTMAALGLTMMSPRRRTAVSALFLTPMALPGLFVGLSLLVLFAQTQVTLSLLTVTGAHVLLTLPIFIVIARSALDRFDPRLLDLAADLGASPGTRFRRVTLPIIGPILAAGAILSFAISFDEFVITSFVIGPTNTVPLVIWSSMHRSIDPSVNALATIVLSVTVLLALLAGAVLALLRARSRRIVTR